MRRTTKSIVAAGAVLTIGLGITTTALAVAGDPPAETRGEAHYTEAHRAEAGVPQAAAERAAQRAHPGRVFDTHLENEGHGLRWEVKTDDGTHVWEIQVDTDSARVVSDQPEE